MAVNVTFSGGTDLNKLSIITLSKAFQSTHVGPDRAVLTDSADDDITIAGSYEVGIVNCHDRIYRINISTAATPDKVEAHYYENADDGWVECLTATNVTGEAQSIGSGLTITFAATTGRTLADKWYFLATRYSLHQLVKPDIAFGSPAGAIPNRTHRGLDDGTSLSTGREEPIRFTKTGYNTTFNYSHPKPDASLIAHQLCQAYGSYAQSGAYIYWIQPKDNEDRTLDGCCIGYRAGNGIRRELHVGMVVNGFTLTQPGGNGEYLNTKCDYIGCGKMLLQPYTEEVAATNDTTVTITYKIDGASAAVAATMIDSMNADLDDDGIFETALEWSSVDATQKIITVTDPGALEGKDVRVTYHRYDIEAESATSTVTDEYAWSTDLDTALKDVSYPFHSGQLTEMSFGGTVSGGADITAAQTLAYSDGIDIVCDFRNFEFALQNSVDMRSCIGGSGEYADVAYRGARRQTLTFSRRLINHVMQYMGAELKPTSFYAKWVNGTHILEVIIPYMSFSIPPKSDVGDFIHETVTATVMENPDGTYRSIYWKVTTDDDGIAGL